MHIYFESRPPKIKRSIFLMLSRKFLVYTPITIIILTGKITWYAHIQGCAQGGVGLESCNYCSTHKASLYLTNMNGLRVFSEISIFLSKLLC